MKFNKNNVRQTKQEAGGGLRPGLGGMESPMHVDKKIGLFWAAASGPI